MPFLTLLVLGLFTYKFYTLTCIITEQISTLELLVHTSLSLESSLQHITNAESISTSLPGGISPPRFLLQRGTVLLVALAWIVGLVMGLAVRANFIRWWMMRIKYKATDGADKIEDKVEGQEYEAVCPVKGILGAATDGKGEEKVKAGPDERPASVLSGRWAKGLAGKP